MKTIIVPTDFSDHSLKGLKVAVFFANNIDANIQLVYVKNKSVNMALVTAEQEQKEAERQFKLIIEKFQPSLKDGLEIKSIIKTGQVFDEIVNQAHSYSDSLIVTSTHGASGFSEYMVGSNAMKIVTMSSVPVITIKGDYCPEKIDKIVLPIDHTSDTRQKVKDTADLAKLFNAEVHIVGHSVTDKPAIIKKIKSYIIQVTDYLKKNDIKFTVVNKTGGSLVDTIIEYTEKNKAQLITIMSEQGTSIKNLFLGNNAEQMLSRALVPVLIISPKELRNITGYIRTGAF